MKKSVALKLYEAANEFLCGRDVYYPYANDKELYEELRFVLESSEIKYKLEQVKCFENPGIVISTISVAFVDIDGELFMDVFLCEVA